MIQNSIDLGIKISSALLKSKGEITEKEIKSIPFVNEKEADFILKRIIETFNVEVFTKKIKTNPFLEWDKIIKLKT